MAALRGNIMDDRLSALIRDMVGDFLYYDRKECDEFPVGRIETMISLGGTSVEEIVEAFEEELRKGLGQ